MKKEFKNIKVLYVEDEENIRINAVSYFKRMFEVVYEASDAYEALDIFRKEKPNIIISDIKMPKMSGLEMIEQIREEDKEVQIIILTAFTQTHYLLKAVELGLVKYLIKPIQHDKFLPVLLQCAKNLNEKRTNIKHLSFDCIFDTFNKTLFLKKEMVKLTKNERDFLNLLCLNEGEIVTYAEIEKTIWYDKQMSEDAIRSLSRNLRKKLPKDALENISKTGYKINIEKEN